MTKEIPKIKLYREAKIRGCKNIFLTKETGKAVLISDKPESRHEALQETKKDILH